MMKLISSKRKISYLAIALQPLIVHSEIKAYDYCVFFHFHQSKTTTTPKYGALYQSGARGIQGGSI